MTTKKIDESVLEDLIGRLKEAEMTRDKAEIDSTIERIKLALDAIKGANPKLYYKYSVLLDRQ